MTSRYLGAAVFGLVLAAATVRAEPYYELRVAQGHLQSAWDHLNATLPDDHGNRDRALRHVNEALREIHLALTRDVPRGRLEEKRWRRDEQLDRKNELREQRLRDKELQRQRRMQER